jgi:GNAT superfamily N-acetyltransferase
LTDPTIVVAQPSHVPQLPGIELAAAALFPVGDLPEPLRTDTTSLEELLDAQRAGRLWVALSGTREPIGMALVGIVDGLPHLEELDVRPEYGRRGVGASLVRTVQAWALEAGSQAISLTTFSHLPWNAPFYERLGFRPLSTDELTPGLRAILIEEARQGLDPAKRVAMRCEIERSQPRFE